MTLQRLDPELTSDDKLWALLSWIFWPIAVVVLLMEDKKSRPFLKYNSVLSLACTLICYIIFFLTPLEWIFAIYMGIMAFQGNWMEVPYLSDFVKKQGWV